jgi:hypothetical protein
MRKESGENILAVEQVNLLLSAAKLERWNQIDEIIVPTISENPDGDSIARELLRYTDDNNSNIRDAVATGLTAIKIENKSVFKKAVAEMILMATTDEEKFPAGRAALFLSKHKGDKELKLEIEEALQDFRKLVTSEGWKGELLKNIPQLNLILKD